MLFQFGGGTQVTGWIRTLQQWGMFDVVLPFLLIFVIFFAILQKVKIFSKEVGGNTVPDKKINGFLAFTFSLMIVVPHVLRIYPPGSDPIIIMQALLPNLAVILLSMLMFMILIGFAGSKIQHSGVMYLVTWAALGFLIFTVLKAVFPNFFPFFNIDPNTQALIVVILTMGLIIWFITKEDKAERTPINKLIKEFSKGWLD